MQDEPTKVYAMTSIENAKVQTLAPILQRLIMATGLSCWTGGSVHRGSQCKGLHYTWTITSSYNVLPLKRRHISTCCEGPHPRRRARAL